MNVRIDPTVAAASNARRPRPAEPDLTAVLTDMGVVPATLLVAFVHGVEASLEGGSAGA